MTSTWPMGNHLKQVCGTLSVPKHDVTEKYRCILTAWLQPVLLVIIRPATHADDAQTFVGGI